MPDEEEMSLEAMADSAVEDLRNFLSAEEQIVQQEHLLDDKLYAFDPLLLHLSGIIPDDRPDLDQLAHDVADELGVLRVFVEEELQAHLHIMQEEKATAAKIQQALAHKDWRAVKKLREEAKKEEKEEGRLTRNELKTIHKFYIDIMRMIKKANAVPVEHVGVRTDKDRFSEEFTYYFTELYNYARAYELIFRKLWEKERMLLRG